MFSSIGRSAVAVSIVMMLLVGICGGIGYWSAGNTQTAITDLTSVTVVVQRHMESDMKHDALRGDVAAAIAALDTTTGISMADAQQAIRTDSAAFVRLVAEAKQNATDPTVLAALNGLDAPLKAYTDSARNIQTMLAKDPKRAGAAFPAFDRTFLTLQDAMDKASNTIEAYAKADNAKEVAKAAQVRITMIAAIAACFALLIGLSLLVNRYLVRPLAALGRVTHDLATGDYATEVPDTARQDELGTVARGLVALRDSGRAKVALEHANAESLAAQVAIVEALAIGLDRLRNGDFTKTIDGEFAPEYAVLQQNFNFAADSLREMIQNVNAITGSIRTGSLEIAQASEDLARRTEGNAASLEQTSAALVQMEGRLKTTATASHSTVARADHAMATVGSGRSTAESAMQAMGRVSGSAKGIDDVIEGLDKIAFQTRVLAMNAAVEAGRAGDAGRGFAVVADLVSALAMRAEEEAKRARGQLSITQSEIVTAVEAVGKVDVALAAISNDVGEVNRLLAGMASDNQAQSSAISEITAAVSSMDRATQQNAAMVEETSAAARSLSEEVGNLAANAAQFNFERRTRRMPVDIERRSGAGAAAAVVAPVAPHRRPAVKASPIAKYQANAGALAVASNDWADF